MSDPVEYKTHWCGVFSRASSSYDRTGPRVFSHQGKKLVEFARIPPGARVLDVACGRGAVFVPASTAVSATGQVIGIVFGFSFCQEKVCWRLRIVWGEYGDR